MKAAVFQAPGRIQVQEMDVPLIGENDVLLKVRVVGICGSDLHTYRTGLYAFPNQVMGHEFCGEVVDMGHGVHGITRGQRVTGFSATVCGECFWCKRQQFRLCPHLFETYTGYGMPGAMAEYVKITDAVLGTNLFVIPDELTDEDAAMAEPLGTALYAMSRTKPQEADMVMVLGAGTIGNLLMQGLKASSVNRVIVTEVSPHRADLARELGADVVINPQQSADMIETVQSLTGKGDHHFGSGGMADIVYDTAATRHTFNDAVNFVRAGGVVALVGLTEAASTVDVSRIILKDIRIVGALGSIIPRGLDYLRRGLARASPLVTHRFALEEADQAFNTLLRDPVAMKVLLLVS